MWWAGHVALMGGKKREYGVLVEKHEEKRPLGRPRLRRIMILYRILGRFFGGCKVDSDDPE
jgi:hypothetical protein